MNHDASHCLNYDAERCPDTCYRAQLTQEYQDRKTEFLGIPVTWTAFMGTDECRLTKRKESLVKWLDEMESALLRAENGKKDLDLIVTMRAVRAMLERQVRDDDDRRTD